jgi:protease II
LFGLNLVALIVDGSGNDQYVLRLKGPEFTKASRTLASPTGAAVAWEHRSGAVIYTEPDEALCPSRIYSVTPDGVDRKLLYQATDESEYLDISVASDGRTVFIARERHSGRSVLRLSPTGKLEPLWEASSGERVFAAAAGARTVLLRTGNRQC